MAGASSNSRARANGTHASVSPILLSCYPQHVIWCIPERPQPGEYPRIVTIEKVLVMNLDTVSLDESMGLPEPLISTGRSMQETLAQKLSMVAAQVSKAAFEARGGDCETTSAHIAHAMSLLRGIQHLLPGSTHLLSNPETHVVRGGLLAWRARRVISHVETNLSRRIHIQELARLLGLSSSHFCRAFRRSFGTSPRDFVLRRRIEAAKALMVTTSETLSSIAVSCGMCDQQHFTHSFRRIVGETPSTWRRTRLGLISPTY